MIHECIIGIGSNIDPEKNIAASLFHLRRDHQLVCVSKLIKTSPIGITNQPDFLNGAARVFTAMEIAEFQVYLKSVENSLHRDRTVPKFGPRTIDLDIIKWDNETIGQDYFTRDFVRIAVDEISGAI